jgi:hypothetical protein
MQVAKNRMNDFRLPRRRFKHSTCLLTPDDYIMWHRRSVEYISEKTLRFMNKPVVVLTHFAPLPFSVDEQYKGDLLNPAFASDLSELIRLRPNIIAWVHGHTHSSFDYFYKNTRIICSPYGYYHERTDEQIREEYPSKSLLIEDILKKNIDNEQLPHYSDI